MGPLGMNDLNFVVAETRSPEALDQPDTV
jgi:hypothetical protein